VASPRAVRIPRAGATVPARTVRVPAPRPDAADAASSPAVVRYPNRSGLQRASRLAMIYLGALIVLYVVFVALDRSGPGGTSPSAESGLLSFTAVAAALAVVGVFVTLPPAPRAVEVSPSSVVVVEWTGHRREFPPIVELRVEAVRRYPASFLSSDPVEAVELYGPKGRRTYQLTEGLLAPHRPSPPTDPR
jgi:hypothetical protein